MIKAIMIRPGAWAFIILLLAFSVTPATASAIPAGATMMPMNSGSGQHGGNMPAGCNCNMPVHATAAAPAPLVPRSAGGQESSPCTGSAVPGLPGMASTPGRFSGIRRIYKKNVLDHPERAAVYETIVARPGIDIAGIAAELGMNRETLRYHLGQLESAARIVVLRDRGIVRYYENHGRYTFLERKVLQHLWNPTAKEVLSLVAAHPGITPSEIAARLDVTSPTVRWYMQRFSSDGIVTGRHEGKYTRYAVAPEALHFLVPAIHDQTLAIAA